MARYRLNSSWNELCMLIKKGWLSELNMYLSFMIDSTLSFSATLNLITNFTSFCWFISLRILCMFSSWLLSKLFRTPQIQSGKWTWILIFREWILHQCLQYFHIFTCLLESQLMSSMILSIFGDFSSNLSSLGFLCYWKFSWAWTWSCQGRLGSRGICNSCSYFVRENFGDCF
jgi:hypothetical protein